MMTIRPDRWKGDQNYNTLDWGDFPGSVAILPQGLRSDPKKAAAMMKNSRMKQMLVSENIALHSEIVELITQGEPDVTPNWEALANSSAF